MSDSKKYSYYSAPEVVPSQDPEHSPQYYQAPEVLPFHNQNPPVQPPRFEPRLPFTPEKEVFHEKKDKKILGVSPKIFWILLVILIVIIAAGVGGGVGGALASSNKSEKSISTTIPTSTAQTPQSAASTPTTTSSVRLSSTSTSSSATALATSLASGCNATNNKIYTPSNSADSNNPFSVNNTILTYKIQCFTNIASSTSGHNPLIKELLRLPRTQTLQECITFCANYNTAMKNPVIEDMCTIPVWVGINPSNPDEPPVCYLQSGPAKTFVKLIFDAGQEIDSAILQYTGVI